MDEKELKHVEGIVDGLETEGRSKDGKIANLNTQLASASMYNSQVDSNLIVYQLELDNILERVEHLLRGDIIRVDGEGNLDYHENPNNKLKILNEYGVQLIMNVVSFYINRNTILSNYDIERIDTIMNDFGKEIADTILCNYIQMGMDSMEKKSRYPLLVINLLHIVESTYRRSLEGGERESLRTGRMVMQNESPGSFNNMNNPQMQKPRQKFSFLNPASWN